MTKRQPELEEQSHKEAVVKRRRELQQAKEKGYMSGTTEGRQLFINLFLPYSEALRRRLDEAMSGKASKWESFAVHTHALILFGRARPAVLIRSMRCCSAAEETSA